MEKISESILAKVQSEAKTIISKAEEKALQEVRKAEQEAELRSEQEKQKILNEAEMEASKILAQTLIEARKEMSKTKTETLTKIRNKVEARLASTVTSPDLLIRLVKEATDGLGGEKARLYTSPRDIDTLKEVLKKDKELAGRVVEVRETDCLGGVVAESIDGKERVDNTYITRLEMLLPRILPDIGKELFETD